MTIPNALSGAAHQVYADAGGEKAMTTDPYIWPCVCGHKRSRHRLVGRETVYRECKVDGCLCQMYELGDELP